MTITYEQIFDDLYSSLPLEKQVTIACLFTANTILQLEPVTLPSNPTESEVNAYTDYQSKLSWARAVLDNPTKVCRKMMPVIITNATVQAGGYSDSDLLWIVDTNVLNFAPVI